MTSDIDQQTARRALEALRNGVPNKGAVSLLGCNQPIAEKQFGDLLTAAVAQDQLQSNSLGMLISGDFGAGKSHLLSYLESQAVSQGFVCSRIVISKETPLYRLDRVFKSAVDNGRIPNQTGQLMEELGNRLDPRSDEYERFFRWADFENNGLSRMFPASLVVHERSDDPELHSKIRAFWSGDRIKVSEIKDGLRQVSQLQNFNFKAPKAGELAASGLKFASELIKGAGYPGWVVLLDEIELVGSYSLLQRARSYAELARWLGKLTDEQYPGLVVVGTVTADYVGRILEPSGKNDHDYVGPRLRARSDDAVAARAEAGMRSLERDATLLEPLTDEGVNGTIEQLRRVYSAAYDWDAPPAGVTARGGGYQARMRYKIRAAINEWDLQRLFPGASPETVDTEFQYDYGEIPELDEGPKVDEERE